MHNDLVSKLKTLHSNLLKEAHEARSHGGPMAMKISSRAKLIQDTIDHIMSMTLK